MGNELVFVFRREALQRLLEANTELILIKSYLEEATLADGSQAGVLRVRAEAVNSGEKLVAATVDGCPIPPCKS